MARFSDELIEKIKAEVSLLKLMQSQGFELKKKGKDYFCCCPFHESRGSDLVVCFFKETLGVRHLKTSGSGTCNVHF